MIDRLTDRFRQWIARARLKEAKRLRAQAVWSIREAERLEAMAEIDALTADMRRLEKP